MRAEEIAALLPKLERLERDAKDRFRRVHGGEWWPSATTILQAMPQPWAKNWAAKVERELITRSAGELFTKVNGQRLSPTAFAATLAGRLPDDYAHDTVSEVACNTGTEAHQMIDWVVGQELGNTFMPEPKIGEAAGRSVAHWVNWREQHHLTSLASETDVCHRELHYTGGVDWIAIDDRGLLVVTDWKTGKSIYPEHHLQMAAYITALRHSGIPVDRGYVIRLPKVEGDPEWREVEVGHMAAGRVYTVEELFDVFLGVKRTWDWLHHSNKPAVTGRTAKKATPPPAPAVEQGSKAAGNGAVETADHPGRGEALPAAEDRGVRATERQVVPAVLDLSDLPASPGPMSEIEAARWRKEAHERLARAGIREAAACSRKVREILGLGEVYELSGPLSGEQWKSFVELYEEAQKRDGAAVLEAAKKMTR